MKLGPMVLVSLLVVASTLYNRSPSPLYPENITLIAQTKKKTINWGRLDGPLGIFVPSCYVFIYTFMDPSFFSLHVAFCTRVLERIVRSY